jgi:hypothetical protein
MKLNHSESVNDQIINSINSNKTASFGNNQIDQKENKENNNDEIIK